MKEDPPELGGHGNFIAKLVRGRLEVEIFSRDGDFEHRGPGANVWLGDGARVRPLCLPSAIAAWHEN